MNHFRRVRIGSWLAGRVEQARNHLHVNAMSEIVRMIHAVAGLIPVLLEFQKAGPDGSQVGECDARLAEFFQRVAVLRKGFLLESDPIAIAEHRRDENELAVGELLANRGDHLFRVGLIVLRGPSGGVVHAEREDHQMRLPLDDLVDLRQPPAGVGPADGEVLHLDLAQEPRFEMPPQQLRICRLIRGRVVQRRRIGSRRDAVSQRDDRQRLTVQQFENRAR